MWLSAIVVFILFSPQAYTQDSCATVHDVAPDLGPVYNQGTGVDWCYAYTANDLLTQKLQKQGALKKGERLHPIALAASYHIDQWRNPSQSQHVIDTAKNVVDALPRLREAGMKLCTEANFGGSADGSNPLFAQSEEKSMALFNKNLNDTFSTGECQMTLEGFKGMKQLSLHMSRVSEILWWNDLKNRCEIPIPEFEDPRVKYSPRSMRS